MKTKVFWSFTIVMLILIVATIGGSFYMLHYSLAPQPNRSDTASCFQRQFEKYPETRPWVDSLRRQNALRDTLVTMPHAPGKQSSGMRRHAYYIHKGSNKTAIVIHGWRNCAIDFLYLARLYERELGFNVVMPDLHAHGLSEGDMVQMGWLDSSDVLCWLSLFQTDTMVVHGVSMGAATTMMTSSKEMPKGIRDIRFIEDCGYTSVWDEFACQLKAQFGLPELPLMYSTSLLCQLRYGWSFGEASAIGEVSKCPYPMLFIHGDSDTFVPTEMVYRLYDAKHPPKKLWIAPGARHALSYKTHKAEYLRQVKDFIYE